MEITNIIVYEIEYLLEIYDEIENAIKYFLKQRVPKNIKYNKFDIELFFFYATFICFVNNDCESIINRNKNQKFDIIELYKYWKNVFNYQKMDYDYGDKIYDSGYILHMKCSSEYFYDLNKYYLNELLIILKN